MGWSPSNTTLGTVDERDAFNFTITYTDDITQQAEDVTITANDPDSNVVITDNNIAGQYEDVFDQTIKYRTVQDTFVEVQKWNEIGDDIYGIYHFIQDTATTRTYTFEATAGSASQTYSIVVNNSLDYDKDKLAEYIALQPIYVPSTPTTGGGETDVGRWINVSGNPVDWINSNNDIVRWIN